MSMTDAKAAAAKARHELAETLDASTSPSASAS